MKKDEGNCVFQLHDNDSTHRSVKATQTEKQCGYEDFFTISQVCKKSSLTLEVRTMLPEVTRPKCPVVCKHGGVAEISAEIFPATEK